MQFSSISPAAATNQPTTQQPASRQPGVGQFIRSGLPLSAVRSGLPLSYARLCLLSGGNQQPSNRQPNIREPSHRLKPVFLISRARISSCHGHPGDEQAGQAGSCRDFSQLRVLALATCLHRCAQVVSWRQWPGSVWLAPAHGSHENPTELAKALNAGNPSVEASLGDEGSRPSA